MSLSASHLKVISVYMDYESDPIWVLVSEGGRSYYVNSDIDCYDFPPILKHLLGCYRDLWESMHSSEFIEHSELADQLSEHPYEAKVLEGCLLKLKTQCESMIEQWVSEDGRNIQLVRRN